MLIIGDINLTLEFLRNLHNIISQKLTQYWHYTSEDFHQLVLIANHSLQIIVFIKNHWNMAC